MLIDQADPKELLEFQSWRGCYPHAVVRCHDNLEALELNSHEGREYPGVVLFDTKERRIYIKKHSGDFNAHALGHKILEMKGVYCGALDGNGDVASVSSINQRKDIDMFKDAKPLISIVHELGRNV